VHAVSGYSGGGKALIGRFESQSPDIAYRSYGFAMGHKHVPEMQTYAGLSHAPLFSPAVVHAFRGMVVEVPLHLALLPTKPSRAMLLDILHRHYAQSPLIRVREEQPEELLLQANVTSTDAMQLYVCADAHDNQARLVATLDNLGKGASGACVQSLNLMAGLPQTEGLIL
jgi:N-acetyl-gamma-glutamyl-phosphate reductase